MTNYQKCLYIWNTAAHLNDPVQCWFSDLQNLFYMFAFYSNTILEIFQRPREQTNIDFKLSLLEDLKSHAYIW